MAAEFTVDDISGGQSPYSIYNEYAMFTRAFQFGVVDRNLTAPPTPTDEQMYIPAATATGDWAGLENKLTWKKSGTWWWWTPKVGTIIWLIDEKISIQWNGTSWININLPITAYAAGTVYSLTNAAAKIDFGTTDPVIIISASGTYRISATARLKYNAATFAANQTATIKLRRTNNTAADLTNATDSITMRIITTLTDNAGLASIDVIYTTTNSDDNIELWGSLDVAPSAGSVDVVAAKIIAIRKV